MANVKSVVQREKGALIHLDDNSKPIWTPEYELAVALIGKPIPSDWTQQKGNYGPQALPPKKGGGGGGGWKNTKEAWELEQANWDRKNALDEQRRRERQAYDQESTNRRTAWMQAVEATKLVAGEGYASHDSLDDVIVRHAEFAYAWLRSSPAPGGQKATKTAQGPAQAVPGPIATGEAVTDRPSGGATLGGSGDSSARVAGTPVGVGSSPSSGEASAASVEPGVDDSGEGVPLGSTRFPVKPEDCSHKFGTTGNWLKTVQIEGKPHCPRCGMSALLYRESDVGP